MAVAPAQDFQMADLFVSSEPKQLDNALKAEDGRCRNQKKPRRVLHFSDGVMEEYSTDEEEEHERKKLNPKPMPVMNPKSLKWGPWLYYWLLYSGTSALSFCDYVGESLANTLGITSPKYQYELDEYHAALEQEETEKEMEEAQMAGWTTTAAPEVGEGIKHKIVDSSMLQEPTQSQPSSQPEIQLAFMKNPQVIELSDTDSSHSEPPTPSSLSFPRKFNHWMSEVKRESEVASDDKEVTENGDRNSSKWDRF